MRSSLIRIFWRRGEWKGIRRPGRWHRRSELDAFHQSIHENGAFLVMPRL
jgi:hypothetical protein